MDTIHLILNDAVGLSSVMCLQFEDSDVGEIRVSVDEAESRDS